MAAVVKINLYVGRNQFLRR